MSNAATSPDGKADLFEKGAVTIEGATTEYGLGRSVLYGLMTSGRLPYSQVNRRRLIPREALRRLLAEGMVGSAG
ncbi:helix-turn-helix domain-containing protein [Gemmata sp.]|uniref:helix-turn-helix domain-containing protein n=1 Tax=Gemmata sp. TaxID=1914242 RepID=UPI003F6EA8DD